MAAGYPNAFYAHVLRKGGRAVREPRRHLRGDLASSDSSFLVGTEIVADGGTLGLKAVGGVSQEAGLRAEAA